MLINGIALLAIGYAARRTQVRDADDYEVAGRRVRWPLISGSLVVTITWASTLLVAAEAGYTHGWNVVWIYPISALGIALMVPFFPRIKKALPKGTTFPEYVRLRFGRNVHMLATLIVVIVHAILLFYLLIGIGYGFAPLFGLSYNHAVLIGGSTIVLFTLLGGLWSSIMTDYFQYLIVWTVSVLAVIVVAMNLGGFGSVYDQLAAQGDTFGFSIINDGVFYELFLVYLFGWITWGIMDQTVWQRMYAISDVKETGKAIAFGFFTWTFLPAMGVLIGIMGLAADVEVESASAILATTVQTYTPAWVIILFALLVFNAIASSMGSILVALSGMITTDVYEGYVGEVSETRKRRLDEILVILAGIFGMAMTIIFPNSILQISIYLGAFFITITVPVYFSFLWNKVTSRALFITMAWGLVIAATLGTAANFDLVDSVMGIQLATWKVYAFMFVTELVLIAGITLIEGGESTTIEEVGERADSIEGVAGGDD